ncbi:MAG TPA: cytochrome c-type biogenesis protein CcmH [Acidimicrobiia bacterium]|nr:cytochrome c-type biogenesis protein CcmH [Acidimicrobiia bacterium]
MSERWRRILSWSIATGLAVTLILVLAGGTPAEDRARALGERIRCPVCAGESIADSPSGTARAMMDLVKARIAEGRTDGEIIDELVASYSGTVLLDPPPRGSTLWLWLLPLIGLAGGAMAVVSRFRASPSSPPSTEATTVPVVSKAGRRAATGGLILIAASAVALATVGQFRQARVDPPAAIDPDTVSNETLEAVIAANLDDPAILGMRLALANRYFEEGDYLAAFPHYEAIIEGDPTALQAGAAFTRLGWMVYDGNGEVEIALDLLDRALEAVPGDPFALYLKGRVLWCGKADFAAAGEMFTAVLASPQLEEDVRPQVEADLAAVQSGTECQ